MLLKNFNKYMALSLLLVPSNVTLAKSDIISRIKPVSIKEALELESKKEDLYIADLVEKMSANSIYIPSAKRTFSSIMNIHPEGSSGVYIDPETRWIKVRVTGESTSSPMSGVELMFAMLEPKTLDASDNYVNPVCVQIGEDGQPTGSFNELRTYYRVNYEMRPIEQDYGTGGNGDLNGPLEIGVHYLDRDLVDLNGDGSTEDEEALLNIKFCDTTTGLWRDAAQTCEAEVGYTRDTTANTLRFKVCHYTQYALSGTE